MTNWRRGILGPSVFIFAAWGALGCLQAAPTADAAANVTVAPDVPVVLDGSGSQNSGGGALTYFWQQISGAPLDLIGQDREYAMVISADQPGVYGFRLRVSDGSQTDTDDMVLTIANPNQGSVIYVDKTLTQNLVSGNYSIANRNGSGSDGDAYKSLQEAADIVSPGDTVYVRGGNYPNTYISNVVYLRILHVTRSGTKTAPIRFEAYNGENVILTGFGYVDQDLDGDGYADGTIYPKKRETLVLIDADYIQIDGLEVTESQGIGIDVAGSFCYVENCFGHDNWENSFNLACEDENGVQGSVFRWLEGYRNRRGSGGGFTVNKENPGIMTHQAMVDCLFYDNGYRPNGAKVLPIASDPAGGGNSDGIAFTKNFSDAAGSVSGVDNLGPNNFVVRNICIHNADDGIDTSIADSLIEGNYSIDNGPEGRKGFKMLRTVSGMVYRGNLAYANESVGFELRPSEGEPFTVLQNSGINNVGQGLLGGGESTDMRNNVLAFNGFVDFKPSTDLEIPYNWAEDGGNVEPQLSGDPKLVNPNLVINMNFPGGLSIRERRAFIEAQIVQAFRPRSDSPLIDQGVLIPGYHCERADDHPVSPMPPSAPGRHWFGAAPDLGAFEYVPDGVVVDPPAPPENLRVVP